MKNILLTLFLTSCLFLNSSLSAQSNFTFRSVNIPSNSGIKDIVFIDSLRGVAINYHNIYSTADAGENWTLKFSTPSTSNFEVINHKGDSIIVTGFYGTTGPTHISFFFNDTTFILDNIPNNHNLAYISPKLFNDSMWTSEGTFRIGAALLAIKDATYRVIDSNACALDIYENRISFYNGTQIKYSLDSSKTWNTVTNVPISGFSNLRHVQTYMDGNSTLYLQKQGTSSNNYEDSAFVSFNLGNTWTRIINTPIPIRFHFIGQNQVVGVDSANFLFSANSGLNFTSIPYDSSFWNPKMWVHSPNRYFLSSGNSGLKVVERNVVTNTDNSEPANVDFNVVPNPASQSFKINIDVEDIDLVQIFDITGKQIETTKIPQNKFDVSNFPNGVYFVTIISNGARVTKKLIVRK